MRVELFKDGCEGYWYNLMSDNPRLFVICFEDDEEGEDNKELRPVVSHVSGGEPLARGDVYEIVSKLTEKGGLPWMICVSNASNLTMERYNKLKDAGMDQLSVSLDFPDDRHSEFRRIPGLYDHMNEVLPEIARNSATNDVSLNTCITAWNYKDLPDIVRQAKACRRRS